MGVYQYKDGKLNSIAGAENAAQVYYDNTGTSLSATNAQDAITELDTNLTPSRYYETDAAAEAAIANIPDGAIVYTNDGEDEPINARQVAYDDGTQQGSDVETQIKALYQLIEEIGGKQMKVYHGKATLPASANASVTVNISSLGLTSANDYYVIADVDGYGHQTGTPGYIGVGGCYVDEFTATSFKIKRTFDATGASTVSYQVVYNA